MKTIALIFGTRPEAIKLCPLIRALREHQSKYRTLVCVTAQHRSMLDQVLHLFEIIPDYDLDLMRDNQSLSDITARALIETDMIIKRERPDIVLVQGDTTTTFVGSLAAYFNRIPVAHVEAGLRTGLKYSPFPEEINRKITGVIADIHFAPTPKTKKNLMDEGVSEKNIVVTGNTVIDALLWVTKKVSQGHTAYDSLKNVDFSKKIILVTGHRRENFGQDFINICEALREIALRHNEVEIVYPVHLNPNVRTPVQTILSGIPNVKLLEPLAYESFVYLMTQAYFIVTDSGGIQEEAPSLRKPVLVTRNSTERQEAVDIGAIELVGTVKEKIVQKAEELLLNGPRYAEMANVTNPYGDGTACIKIINALDGFFLRDSCPS